MEITVLSFDEAFTILRQPFNEVLHLKDMSKSEEEQEQCRLPPPKLLSMKEVSNASLIIRLGEYVILAQNGFIKITPRTIIHNGYTQTVWEFDDSATIIPINVSELLAMADTPSDKQKHPMLPAVPEGFKRESERSEVYYFVG